MENILDSFTKNLEKLLEDISKTYSIDYDELKDKYIGKKDQVSVPKKRGRKKKQKEEFIEAEEFEYEGVTYLVDDKNNVYTNNVEAPNLVGEKLVNGSIRFYNA